MFLVKNRHPFLMQVRLNWDDGYIRKSDLFFRPDHLISFRPIQEIFLP